MCVASFLRARLPGEKLDQRRLALHQPLQRGLHDAQVVKLVHAVRATAKFARGLRASQQQFAQDGGLVAGEVEGFLKAVLVLGDATDHIVSWSRQFFFIEAAQSFADGVFIDIHEWIAIGFLIARVNERVQ
jgi:hypothetical protein